MEIKELKIQNYKSIKDISIKNPNPFTVFVGPNAAGKSNIFEALEFYTTISNNFGKDVVSLFSDIDHYSNNRSVNSKHYFDFQTHNFQSKIDLTLKDVGLITAFTEKFFHPTDESDIKSKGVDGYYWLDKNYVQFFTNFCRIFVGNKKSDKLNRIDNRKLSSSCSNLEQVLKRVFLSKFNRDEIAEWIEMLVPEFKSVEIKTEELSGSTNLLIYEKGIQKPLTKKIISDGTYNIIAILTALYQSDEPQFLCIEEPENGLNPKVVRELVSIFRQQCKDKGHFIWLNTHSQTIVSELTNDEIILVDKKDGETKIKQIQGMDLHGLRMDEALLTNAIGGGIPW